MSGDYLSFDPDFIPEYDFTQLLAEVMQRAGREALEPIVMSCARRYGWPIPPMRRGDTIRRLAPLFR